MNIIAALHKILAESEEKSQSGVKEDLRIDKWLATFKSIGKPGDQVWAENEVLHSYYTIIAKKVGNTLYINETKYSKTTSALTHHLKFAAEEKGYKVIYRNEAFFETKMAEKLPMGFRRM